MSKRVVLEREDIGAGAVRVGDIIRVDIRSDNQLGWFGPSLVKSVEIEVTSTNWAERVMQLADSIALISRIIEVPTEPYSVIAPPESSRTSASPLVLDYSPDGDLGWYREGVFISEVVVLELLESGWRPAYALNETLTEEVVADEF